MGNPRGDALDKLSLLNGALAKGPRHTVLSDRKLRMGVSYVVVLSVDVKKCSWDKVLK